MKISKHLHSCLLIEDDGKVFLLDPGNYTAGENALNLNTLSQLDYILITHEHQDHMHIPFIKILVEKFPHVKIKTTNSAKDLLRNEGLQASSDEDEFISLQQIPHEKIWMGPAPENVLITINNRFSSPGDSLTFEKSTQILALPIQAPWGHSTWAVETALKTKPKIIIPIHDFHLKDDFRKMIYERFEQFFKTYSITFLKPETGFVFDL